MKWHNFIEFLRSLDPAYEGKGEDLQEVQSWLKNNGHDHEAVDAGDESYALKDLYDSRLGRKLDVSDAAEKSRREDEIRDRVRAEVEEWRKLNGLDRTNGAGRTRHTHDVKVGRDRLGDDPKGGFKSLGDFCCQVIANETSGRMPDALGVYQKATLSTYGNEGSGADGGFAVPEQWRSDIMAKVVGEDSILARCTQIPLSTGNSMTIPYDEDEPWRATGIQAYWEGEAGAATQVKPLLTQKELRLRKLIALVPVTEELMSDAPAMGAYVSRRASDAISHKVGEAIFRGTGGGMPFGFLNSSALLSVAKETDQIGATVQANNILKMYSRMYAPWRRDAVWFIHQDVEPSLFTMAIGSKLAGGTATSGGGPIYLPPGGTVAASPNGMLLGRPVIVTQHCATVGTVGDICFCAMREYVCLSKGGVEGSTSIHLFFDQDTVCLKWRLRLDGQPFSNSVITPRTGSNTMSAFVALAVRS
jgi:HK97 family phage major capsid protein